MGLAASRIRTAVFTVVASDVRFVVTTPQLIEALLLIIRYECALQPWVVLLPQTQQNCALSFVGNESVLAISQDNASVGVMHESVVITGVAVESLKTVGELEVVLDSTFCTPDLKLGHADFRCGAGFFVMDCPAEV